MAKKMTIFTPGDRFATMGKNGEARIWQVSENGIPDLAGGADIPRGEPKDLRSFEGGIRYRQTS